MARGSVTAHTAQDRRRVDASREDRAGSVRLAVRLLGTAAPMRATTHRPQLKRPTLATGTVIAAIVVGVSACSSPTAQRLPTSKSSTTTGALSTTGLPTVKGEMAALGVILPKVSCASLENETSVSGLAVAVTSTTEGRATPTSPEYCDVQGTIAQYIGFQVLLPTQTWRQRYLQLGCSALCGTISLGVPQSTGYSALAGGYFVIASDDQGHTGSDTAEWGANATQRVDFAYLADHDTAVVAKGLASDFYSQAPRYSYFDGCSQGGHEALTEVQRYPNDFNGVLTGAPASIMTELNSLMEEWAADANISSTDRPIVTTAQTALVHQAVLSQCGG